MKKMIFLASMLGLAMPHGRAQQKVGWEFGPISTNYFGTVGGTKVNTAAKVGIKIAVDFDFRLAGNLSLESGLCFVTNGFREQFYNGTTTVNVETLEIPANLELYPGKSRAHGLFLGAGPYLAYNVAGQETFKGRGGYNNSDAKLTIGNKPENDIRLLDWGLGANLGYVFNGGIFFRGYYQVGLKNLSNQSNELMLNRNAGICVGYIMSPKKNKKSVDKKDKPKSDPFAKDE